MRLRDRGLARFWAWLGVILGAVAPGVAYGQAAGVVFGQQEQAVLAGVQFLRGHYANKQSGESAMIALALLKAEVPPTDPAVAGCLARCRIQCQDRCRIPRRIRTRCRSRTRFRATMVA